jgi:hypothetical protein
MTPNDKQHNNPKRVSMKTILKSMVVVLILAGLLGVTAKDADASRNGGGRMVASHPVNRGPVSRGPVVRGPVAKGPITKGPVVKGPVGKGSMFSSPKYHLTHGTKFSHGYYFKGREHRHFRYRYWHHHRHHYMYYYPGTHGWYYWSGKRNAYYPMSYASTVPPSGQMDTGDLQDLPAMLPTGVTPPPEDSMTPDDDA